VLHELLHRVLVEERWPCAASFDPDDDAQLDDVARRLLERYAARRDAEAFALLMHLTRGRLLDIATRLAARPGRELTPASLVEAALRRLFNDPPRSAEAPGGFFAVARRQMEGLIVPAPEDLWRQNSRHGPYEAH